MKPSDQDPHYFYPHDEWNCTTRLPECLTRDRGAVGLPSPASLSKTHLSLLSTGSTQEDPSRHNWKIVDRDVKNQINQNKTILPENGINWESNVQPIKKGLNSVKILQMMSEFVFDFYFTLLYPSITCPPPLCFSSHISFYEAYIANNINPEGSLQSYQGS